jgi:hypothetical protein
MPTMTPGAPQDARPSAAGSVTPAEATSASDGARRPIAGPSCPDPLADYAWRERGLGVAQPLTWSQRRQMRWLITTGRAAPLPIAEQRCWRAADLRWLLAGATRVIVKPDGKLVLR